MSSDANSNHTNPSDRLNLNQNNQNINLDEIEERAEIEEREVQTNQLNLVDSYTINPMNMNMQPQCEGSGFFLFKTKSQALIARTNKSFTGNESIPNIYNSFSPEEKRDAILINIEDLEEHYLKNDLIEESGKIDHSKQAMENLKREVEGRHPFKVKNGQMAKLPCCGSNLGFICCCGKVQKSDFDDLGIGMVTYFKLMKTLLISFFIITLFSAALSYVYYSNDSANFLSINDLIFKTTLGNIPNSLYNCESFNKNITKGNYEFKLNCGKRVINSVINFGISKSQNENENLENCNNYMGTEELVIEPQKCNLKDEINKILEENSCNGKQDCSFTVDLSSKNFPCDQKDLDLSDINKIFFSYSCYQDEMDIGVQNISVQRKIMSYIIVVVDIVCSLILYISLKVVSCYKEKNELMFSKEKTFISEFTLHVKNVKIKKIDLGKEFENLINHFIEVAKIETVNQGKEDLFDFKPISKKKNDRFKDYVNYPEISKIKAREFFIFDIVYPVLTAGTVREIKNYNEYKEKYFKSKKLIENIYKENPMKMVYQNVNNNNPNLNIPNSSLSCTASINNLNNINQNEIPNLNNPNNIQIFNNVKPTTQKDIKSEIKKRDYNYKKMEEIKQNIHFKTDSEEIEELFIIFRNHKIAKFFYDLYNIGSCRRCLKGNKLSHLYYNNNSWLYMEFPSDEPTNIKWENRNLGICSKFMRGLVSFLLAVVALFITTFAILRVKKFQEKADNSFNTNLDCDYVEGYENETKVYDEFNDTSLNAKQQVLSFCFCYSKLNAKSILNSEISKEEVCKDGDCQNPCESFVYDYGKAYILNLVLVVAIPIINAIMGIILRCLTSFQKNETLSNDLTSNLWKIFLIQFINTGLLLLIINAKIDSIKELPWFPIFAGDFKDIDPNWYSKVGATMTFSMILGIITPHLGNIAFGLWAYLCRCRDSGCYCDGKITKKELKKDYFKLYTGPTFPMDERYATILTNLFVTLVFSSGIPILNVIFFIFLLLVYILDKWFVVCYYKKPPKYDLKIVEYFIIISLIGIFVHVLFGIWIYGNPHILVSLDPTSDWLKNSKVVNQFLQFKESFWQNVIERLTMSHNIFMLIFFVLILLIEIFQHILGPLFYKFFYILFCCCLCKKKKEEESSPELREGIPNIEIGLSLPLKELYKYYQIKKIEYFNDLKNSQDLQNLLYNIRCSLHYIRSFMIYKIYSVLKMDPTKFILDFENSIKGVYSDLEREKNVAIDGDVSYNLAFLPEYESVTFYEYLQNM